MNSKLLFICGSRDFPSTAAIEREIKQRMPDFVLNGAGGDADVFSSRYAHESGIHAIEVAAIWDVGKHAGPIRNAAMAMIIQVFRQAGWEVSALAFSVTDPPVSRGTSDMVARLKRFGIKPEIVTK